MNSVCTFLHFVVWMYLFVSSEWGSWGRILGFLVSFNNCRLFPKEAVTSVVVQQVPSFLHIFADILYCLSFESQVTYYKYNDISLSFDLRLSESFVCLLATHNLFLWGLKVLILAL